MSDPTRVFDDLREEGEELDRLVAELGPEGWALETPAARWTVAHQIAHLAWTDHSALLAVTDQEAFRGLVEKALAAPSTFVDDGAAEGAAKPPGRLLDDWRAGRAALLDALYAAPRGLDSRGTDRPCQVRPWQPGALWRPGPTGRMSPMRWAWCGPLRIGFGMWCVSGCGPGTSPSVCVGFPRRARSSGSNSAPRRGVVELRPRGRSAARHRPRSGLLSPRHPARAPRRPRRGGGGARRRPVARHRSGLRGAGRYRTTAEGERP